MNWAKWIGLGLLSIAIACCLMWPRTLPRQGILLDTARCRNVKVSLDDALVKTPLFKAGSVVRIKGEMEVEDRPQDVCEVFLAYLVSPHDPHGEVIENTCTLTGTRSENKIKFSGDLNVRERVGEYELRISVTDVDPNLPSPVIYFYRQSLRVAKSL